MKINSTAQSLSLALHALSTSVAPDVTSPAAKNAVETITVILNDVLKRQGPAVQFLRDCVVNGQELELEIRKIVSGGHSSIPVAPSKMADFDALLATHTELTLRLVQLCHQLHELVNTNPKADSALRRAAEWELSYYTGIQRLKAEPFGEDVITASTSVPRPPTLSREYLKSFISKQHGPVEITSFCQIPGGYGNETFAATIMHKSKEKEQKPEELIIRKSDNVPIVLPLEQEFDLLRCLATTDFPAPHPIDLCSPGIPEINGPFYTMPRLPGHMASSAIEATQNDPAATAVTNDVDPSSSLPREIFIRLGTLLGKLHSLPLSTFSSYIHKYNDTAVLRETIAERHHRKIADWRAYSTKVDHSPSPFTEWLFNWLERNVPDDTRKPVLSHGDYNLHNVLVTSPTSTSPSEVSAVLDWECADFGAPEQDLAYLQPAVSRVMSWDEFLEYYYASGGIRVSHKVMARNMQFCAAYSALRLALASQRFTVNLQEGRSRDAKFIMIEQGLASIIMNMGLGCVDQPNLNVEEAKSGPGRVREAFEKEIGVATHLEFLPVTEAQ